MNKAAGTFLVLSICMFLIGATSSFAFESKFKVRRFRMKTRKTRNYASSFKLRKKHTIKKFRTNRTTARTKNSFKVSKRRSLNNTTNVRVLNKTKNRNRSRNQTIRLQSPGRKTGFFKGSFNKAKIQTRYMSAQSILKSQY